MIKIGVIGYGYWGPNLVRNFSETEGLTVACVADLDPKKLDLVKKRYPGIKTTTDFGSMLNDPDIHAIAIATPVSTHFDLGMAALQAGKHLWLEKPMTETSKQAQQLVEEAEKRNLVLIVDHTFVYTSAVRKIAEIIHKGDLGEVYYYDSIRINLGLFQHDVNVISDLAVHDFSILDFLFNKQPYAVSAVGANNFSETPHNLAYISLFYDDGMIAHSNVNWLAPVKVRQILIGGSKKMITYDDVEPSEKIKIYDKGVSFTDDPKKIYAMRVGYRTGDMWAPQLDTVEALKIESEHFVDCINNGKTPRTDGKLGMRVVQIIEAATRSMNENGRSVNLQGVQLRHGKEIV